MTAEELYAFSDPARETKDHLAESSHPRRHIAMALLIGIANWCETPMKLRDDPLFVDLIQEMLRSVDRTKIESIIHTNPNVDNGDIDDLIEDLTVIEESLRQHVHAIMNRRDDARLGQ